MIAKCDETVINLTYTITFTFVPPRNLRFSRNRPSVGRIFRFNFHKVWRRTFNRRIRYGRRNSGTQRWIGVVHSWCEGKGKQKKKEKTIKKKKKETHWKHSRIRNAWTERIRGYERYVVPTVGILQLLKVQMSMLHLLASQGRSVIGRPLLYYTVEFWRARTTTT